MNVKVIKYTIDSNQIPRKKGEETKLLNLCRDILNYFERNMNNAEIINVDYITILAASIFSSKIVNGILESIYEYILGKWDGKQFSGDVSAVIGQSIGFALLESLFDIPLTEIIPLRNVKYLGLVSDTVINIGKYEKLKKFLGIDRGILFFNSRSTTAYRRNYVIDKLMKSILNIETMRYPSHYGLISYSIFHNKEIFALLTVINPAR